MRACIDLVITLKNSMLVFYLQVLQKWITIIVPQSSHLLFCFFCTSNCLFRVFIYLTPLLPSFCTVLIYFPFLHPRSLLFNEKTWYCLTFFQLVGRCSNCNHFYQPYKTEGYKVQEPNSCSQMFFKIGVLKNFANFTGKNPYWNLLLIKLQALRPATLLKRDSNTCFPVKFAKVLRICFFLQNISSDCFYLSQEAILTGSHQPKDFLRMHSTTDFSQ